MNKFILLFIIVSLHQTVASQESLFNGENLEGWNIHGTELWYVDHGLLVCESGPDAKYGYLGTEKFYKNFILNKPLWSSSESTLKIGQSKKEFDEDPVLERMEIQLKASGIKPNKIVFSGVGKTEEELKLAIQKKILLIKVIYILFCCPSAIY